METLNNLNPFYMKNNYCFKTSLALLLLLGLSACKIPTYVPPKSYTANLDPIRIGEVKKQPSTTDQSKKLTVTIDWLTPRLSDTKVVEKNGKVEITLKISSAIEIRLDQVDIFVNGVNVKSKGEKADPVNLYKRPEVKDQVLTTLIPLTLGNNDVRVEVITIQNERFFANMVLKKETQGISIVKGTSTGNNGASRLVWAKPDIYSIAGKMFNAKENLLEIAINIIVPPQLKVSKEHIRIAHNALYKDPSPRATLTGGDGSYIFSDWVALSETLDVNEIGIRVAIPGSPELQSERLKVNFSPSRANLYLLSIGTKLNLRYSEKDARDFVQIFTSQQRAAFKMFGTITVDSLFGPKAVTSEIRRVIESIRNKIKTNVVSPDDMIMIFISSHGFVNDKSDFRIQGNDYDPALQNSTSVSYQIDILDRILDLPCKKIVFLDACHSGGARANAADINLIVQELKNAPSGLAVFASSQGDESSYEDVKWENGAFTEALIAALRDGKCDNSPKDGYIRLDELEKYVTAEVPLMVKAVKGSTVKQTPKMTRKDLKDIPIFITKKP